MNDEIDIFLERAVHDLRSAGRAVALAAEMGIGTVAENVEKMNQILDGIASYATAARHSDYAREELSAEHAVIAAMQLLRQRLEDAGATVERRDLPVVLGDSQRVAELFGILFLNAIVYRGEAAPAISIKAVPDDGFWIFSVCDNGIGVEEKFRERVFTPFHRLHGPARPGVGLGLSIARKIVQGHGGSIWIDAPENTGAKVSFRLPKAA
jgi:signal transduction histidine kinase